MRFLATTFFIAFASTAAAENHNGEGTDCIRLPPDQLRECMADLNRNTERFAEQKRRWNEQVLGYAAHLPSDGYSYFIARKGQGSHTLQNELWQAAININVNILAFPLVDVWGKLPDRNATFDVWVTENGDNDDLELTVSSYSDKVTSMGPFWRLKVGTFSEDMVVFVKLSELGFASPPSGSNELGCLPRPKSWEEGQERGCF